MKTNAKGIKLTSVLFLAIYQPATSSAGYIMTDFPKKGTVKLINGSFSGSVWAKFNAWASATVLFISAHWSFHERTEGKWWKEAKETLIGIKARKRGEAWTPQWANKEINELFFFSRLDDWDYFYSDTRWSFRWWFRSRSHFGHGQFSIRQRARLPDTSVAECLRPQPPLPLKKKKHVANQFPSVVGSECLFVPNDSALKPAWCLN